MTTNPISSSWRGRLGRLAQLVAGSQDARACAQCRERLPDYVEAESEGQDAAQLYPQVRQHLEICLACQKQYADQLTLARQEASNELPQLAQSPRFDLSFLPSRRSPAFEQTVYESAKRILQSARPDYVAELEAVRDRLLEILDNLADRLSLQAPATVPALGFADQVPAARWVVATLIGLEKARAAATREEIERLKSANKLREFLSSRAQEAAQQAGLGRGDARKFASAFAEVHSEERWEELIASLF